MEQQETKRNQPVANNSPFRPLAIRNLVPGMVIGILLGIAAFLIYQRHLPQVTQTLYIVTLVSFGVLVLTFVLLYAFKKQITALIFGKGVAHSSEVIDDAQVVTDALTDRVAATLLMEAAPEVQQRVRHVLPRLANWFIWSRFRNWWWQWVLGIFVSLGGLTGTLLLMNQNELLEAQNIKIDSQTELMNKQMFLSEASRRSALVVLMSNIMDKVDNEIESQQKGLSFTQKEKRKYRLSQSLIGQIAALSHSFKPYKYMDGDSLIGRQLSPERGLLLTTLSLLPLDSSTISKIHQSATFEFADLRSAILVLTNLAEVDLRDADLTETDLRGANLSGANLSGADFARADLRAADLSEATMFGANLSMAYLSVADLEKTRLGGANLTGAALQGAVLISADLSRAGLSGADLSEANLTGAFLSEADLTGGNLERVDLTGADLRGANLKEAFLKEADLMGADLRGADLTGANLTGANLKEADLNLRQLKTSISLRQSKNLNDSLLFLLQQSHPQLFRTTAIDDEE